ncbi:high light inducible protein [Prochlorococcus marinus]|uniref:high light inducible protein n=1 Tax=Prochlorococcus marinus TaxID=1219 RepID=UPI0039AFB500
MSEIDSEVNNQIVNSEPDDTKKIESQNSPELIDQSQSLKSYPKWINNKGEEVKQVFGFNENAELVNARVAMIGFLMLLLTELAFGGEPATLKIFGIS